MLGIKWEEGGNVLVNRKKICVAIKKIKVTSRGK